MTPFYIIWIIFWLTLLQKFYYDILHKISSFWLKINFLYRFIIRFWVIIHEFCHMFFAVLSWNKITKIDLFRVDWGEVVIMSKDYIWELPKYGFSFNFLFFMILNQIWLFLVSFGPLIFWLLSSYLICYYFWIENLKDILKINFSVWNVLFLVFYYLNWV